MIGAFKRLGVGVLRHLGEDSFLLQDGARIPCRVNIEHDVAVAGPYGDAVLQKDIMSFLVEVGARQNDLIEHPDGTYRLDETLSENGSLHRFVVTKV